MGNRLVVHKGRVNVVQVNLGIDVSADTITSEIRSEPNVDAPLVATWAVTFDSDGTDGKLILTLDDSTDSITASAGYMDLKRVTGGDPVPVFDAPLEVVFRGSVTA